MRENRTYGSEGGETGTTGLPYPYFAAVPAGTVAAILKWTVLDSLTTPPSTTWRR
jgi:hypothetical protein